MRPAFLNRKYSLTGSLLAFLLIRHLSKDPREVVEAFHDHKILHTGAGGRITRTGSGHQGRCRAALDDLGVTENQRILINQQVQKLEEQGQQTVNAARSMGRQMLRETAQEIASHRVRQEPSPRHPPAAGGSPEVRLQVRLPIEVFQRLLKGNLEALKLARENKNLSDHDFRELANFVLSD